MGWDAREESGEGGRGRGGTRQGMSDSQLLYHIIGQEGRDRERERETERQHLPRRQCRLPSSAVRVPPDNRDGYCPLALSSSLLSLSLSLVRSVPLCPRHLMRTKRAKDALPSLPSTLGRTRTLLPFPCQSFAFGPRCARYFCQRSLTSLSPKLLTSLSDHGLS